MRPAAGSADEQAGPPSRLLLVEDEPYTRAAAAYFEARGYAVDAASRAGEALEAAAARPPDLLIADIHLGGRRTGLDVARALRGRRPALSVIVLTGVSERELEERARELDGFTVLRKPLRLLELEAQVRRLLGGDAGGGEPPSARGQGPVARGQ